MSASLFVYLLPHLLQLAITFAFAFDRSELTLAMMFHLFTSSLLLIALLSAGIRSAHGACLPCQRRFSDIWYPEMVRRDVYSPKITSPNSLTKWVVGKQVIVEWDLHDMPKHITNTEGKIVLGIKNEGSPTEHLDLKRPLVQGFDIRQGNIAVTVPFVKPGKDYIIVLFGDSGNRSPAFRIKGIDA